jgi:two-component system chemotaxis response regulator CheY
MQTGQLPSKCGVGKTVLIVDDNATLRTMVAAAFLSDGFKACGQAENGKEGIEVAKQIRPHLVILDLSMPVMNGLEAAFKIREILPETPIILFTLFGDSRLEASAYKAGVSAILPKTAALRTLIEKAHELILN